MHQETEPLVRLSRPGDMGVLRGLDLKCYPYPLSMDEWQSRVEGSGKENEARVIMVEVGRLSVGFAMWSIDQEENEAWLLRLGVIGDWRRRGLGELLMAACLRHIMKYRVAQVKVLVPDCNCQGDEDDVTGFLHHCGFEATGETVYNWGRMYGKIVDGYYFVRKMNYASW